MCYSDSSDASSVYSDGKMALTSANELGESLSHRNEHPNGLVTDADVMVSLKGELLRPKNRVGIDVFATYGPTAYVSSVSHSVMQYHCLSSSTLVSHCCHVTTTPSETGGIPETASDDEWKADMWNHMLKIKNCSFSRALKRRNDVLEDASLCESFDSMSLSRKKNESLESQMKRLCIDSAPSASDVVPTSSRKLLPLPPVSAAATCNTASQVLMYASPNCFNPKTPDAAKNDVLCDDQVDSDASANGSDALPVVLVDNGNGEAKLNSGKS